MSVLSLNKDDRLLLGAMFFSALLHALVVLAWQPQPFPAPQERGLRAVLLPPVEAQPERQQTEPPPPRSRALTVGRAVNTLPRPSPAALSDGASEPLDAAPNAVSPVAFAKTVPVRPASTDAGSGMRLSEHAGLASSSPEPPRAMMTASAASAAVIASRLTKDDGLSVPAEGAATASPAPPGSFTLTRQSADAASNPWHHTSGSSTPSTAQPLEAMAADTTPPVKSPSTLRAAQPAEIAMMTAMGTATSSQSVLPPAYPGSSTPALPDPVPSLQAVAAGQTDEFATVSVTPNLTEVPSAAMTHSVSTRVGITLLARAEAGQPVAVADAGSGSNEFANYADGNPEFVYPRAAARLGLEGTVLLEVEVKADGSAGEIQLKRSSGHQILDMDAVRQIASWRFKPATSRGRAHSARVLVPVSYRLVAKGRP